MEPDVISLQQSVCDRCGVECDSPDPDLKLGISPHVRSGTQQINGLRISSEEDTTGWYIWAGEELSTHPEFFSPLHVRHVRSWCPQVLPYLGLPPGWRFLIAPGHEDVWYDPSLLDGSTP